MKTIFTYDTETTGIPNWKVPSDSPEQPHLVQLAGVLSNAETGEEIQSMNVIIKPDGWEIPEEVTAVHGITTEYALEHGIPEGMAVAMLHMIRGEAERVAYNKTFDQRIIRIAMKRYMSEECIEKWAVKDDHHCAMRMAQKELGGKNPKLVDAYKAICGKDLVNAHSAMADTLAAQEIFFKLNSGE
ncbi:exonuclease [Vibrio phage 1.183.O._10N.286.48.B7]|nr:exonuclease [Vibrio phage 1.183.O._10N.286.48.B7]